MKSLLVLTLSALAIVTTITQKAKAQPVQYLEVNCTSTGQQCNNVATFTLNSDGPGAVYQLNLKAPNTHCSAVNYTVFDRNSLPLQTSGGNQYINANQSITVPLGNNLARGRHTFYIGAEGRIGGCNSGRVGSWGVHVTPQIVPQ